MYFQEQFTKTEAGITYTDILGKVVAKSARDNPELFLKYTLTLHINTYISNSATRRLVEKV